MRVGVATSSDLGQFGNLGAASNALGLFKSGKARKAGDMFNFPYDSAIRDTTLSSISGVDRDIYSSTLVTPC